MSVGHIDLKSFTSPPCQHLGGNGAKRESERLRELLRSCGFLYVSGHDIDPRDIKRTFEASRCFFAGSMENKQTCESTYRARRGYSKFGAENFATLVGEVRPNDLVEKYRFGPPQMCPSQSFQRVKACVKPHIDIANTSTPHHGSKSDPAAPKSSKEESSDSMAAVNSNSTSDARGSLDEYFKTKAGRSHFAPNVFPQHDDGKLESCVRRLYKSLEKLARQLAKVFETALNMPAHYLDKWFDGGRHTSIMTLNSYPALSEKIIREAHRTKQCRISAHTDVSLFTLLLMNMSCPDGGGLEIQLPDSGKWLPVQQKEACVIVNVGDLLADWSNGTFVSTMHRVSLPPLVTSREEEVDSQISQISQINRLSIAFFATPAYDAIITPFSNEGEDETGSAKSKESKPYLSSGHHRVWAVSYDKWRRQRIKAAMKNLKWKAQKKKS